MTATIESMQPTFAIMCPAIVSILILLFGKWPNIRESWTLIAAIAQFLIVISMAPVILAGNIIECTFFTMLPGVDFGFSVDAFGLIFAITSSFLWILVSLYSIGYMRSLNEHAQTRFYFFFALAIFGAVGIAMSGNLFTMFIFYEILTVSTYPLVAHEQTPVALSAGRKYLVYLLTSGTFFLAAIVLTYYFSGTTDFVNGGIPNLASEASRTALMILFVIFLLGFMKAAWMPFHSWLPTAMAAPTPVSALLHAVAVVKAGVFGIIRVVCYIYGVDLMSALGLGLALACLAAFTMIVANLFAIGEDNLKRRLAYSTINQLSFIILGVALLSPMGITGAMIHIPFHGFMKITLFMCAGAIIVATGKKNVSEMAGIGRTMPVTMAAFTIAAFGMCGIPPVSGFISKWYICLGSIQSPGMVAFLFIAVTASLLDVVYFFPIIRTAFFEKPAETNGGSSEEETRNKETEHPLYLFMLLPLAITAIFSIIFCLFPNTFYIFDLVQMAIKDLFGGVV
ncbi:MAG: F(420)H(2) dehydrogenase subunit L [Candidatus Argoarchaeum ethanivorans]|uniref:F(420)H(2) dehydrogenase subunit L n=1 Tax=Candidatus Argoarchaeum ethanivorans TaxID=2608793 RepID=A0A811TBG9_9EURY|nr:MAG: F(420)H(2) dehydrogenase subunit L [Candidatus Argoarchaeum ethanivorans]